MAPPKLRLHKSTGKLKTIPRPSTNGPPAQPTTSAANGVSNVSPSGPLSSDSDRQFELELYWCIQQLETSLSLPHVRESNKKVEDTNKLINTLKSGSQPTIRKRQIMRTTFGDYRSKMAAEEQSLSVDPESVRFEEQKDKVKYHFVKKSSILQGGKDFRFNFANNGNETAAPPALDDVNDGVTGKQAETTKSHECKLVPSDNSFRFNFASE